ncbi:MAG: cation:proton antiporter [Burkholderiales bacterium]|nr:cation:proton antiporter [Burkholderiales bacterium]
MSVFQQFALLLLIATALGLIAGWLKQPLILAYIVMGVAAGPALVGWAAPAEALELLAEFGVTMLLFAVGLKLDPRLVRHLGPVALATGLGQLGFTIVIGYAICVALGYDWVSALYVAIALTFSSTIIIVKLLSDKREIDSLHGRVAMGFLIVQDIAVVIALMVLGSLREAPDASVAQVALATAVKLAGAAAVVWLALRFVVPQLARRAARSGELLLLASIAWGVLAAAGGELAGFSKEVGAFLAGFTLAATPFRDAVAGRMASVRDFLLLFFFIELGLRLEVGAIGGELLPAAILSAFVLIGNPLIVMAIMGFMGFRARTGLLAGLTVAQISEFSIVFVAMGVTLGHVGGAALAVTTTVGIVTIAASTYMILYSEKLYEWLKPLLGVFERQVPYREVRGALAPHDEVLPEVIVFGMGRYGRRLAEQLQHEGHRVLGVDFDPELVRGAAHAAVHVRFGDASDPGLLDDLPLASTRWAVVTLPEPEDALALVAALRARHYRGRIALAARSGEDMRRLSRTHPDLLLRPFQDAADHAARTLITSMES